MSEDVFDAGAALGARDGELARPDEPTADGAVQGARGRAQLGSARRGWPVGARTFFVLTGLVAAGLVTALLLKARATRREAEARAKESPAATERVERRVPPLKLAAAPPSVAVPASLPSSLRTAQTVSDPSEPPPSNPETELLQRRLARGFGAGEGESSPRTDAAPASPAAGTAQPARKASALEEKLEPMELRAASAGVLPDRDHLITQGAVVDCALETKIVSSVAGMTSCHLTRDVYSTSGRVVLLDRGSRVVGRYQAGLQQGDARIFVVWTRVETPAGVVVNLDSPGTGPLGEAGLDGNVDTHFWDRFGAAILLSIIEGGVDAAAARAGGTASSTTINVANTANAGKDVIARSMEPTINIPPTLVKNQGERVGIFVARDLDFRGVYGLERAHRGPE